MSEPGRKGDPARELAAATVFHSLSVLLFPLTLVGYAIYVGALLAGRKAGGSS